MGTDRISNPDHGDVEGFRDYTKLERNKRRESGKTHSLSLLSDISKSLSSHTAHILQHRSHCFPSISMHLLHTAGQTNSSDRFLLVSFFLSFLVHDTHSTRPSAFSRFVQFGGLRDGFASPILLPMTWKLLAAVSSDV